MVTLGLLIIAAISGWIVRMDHTTQIHNQTSREA